MYRHAFGFWVALAVSLVAWSIMSYTRRTFPFFVSRRGFDALWACRVMITPWGIPVDTHYLGIFFSLMSF
jgi:hypothetical protein